MFPVKSLRTFLYLILVTLGIQLLIALTILFFQTIHEEKEGGAEQFSHLETLFLEVLTMEREAETDLEERSKLPARWAQISALLTSPAINLDKHLIEDRTSLNNHLLSLKDERADLYTLLNTSLPNLAASVTYIHTHHLAYLGNMLAKGVYSPDRSSDKNFTKDDAKPASELDIISEAIEIQNSVLAIIEIFSRLQRGMSPKQIELDFHLKMDHLYKSTSAFEAYSLDAQDGLLVEELLENGRSFEQSFTRFLALEEERTETIKKLSDNRKAFLNQLSVHRSRIRGEYEQFNKVMEVFNIVSAIISFLMVGTLLLLSRMVIRSLSMAVKETGIIRKNPQYRISLAKNQFYEFNFLFSGLNSLAEDVTKKLVELQDVQKGLEQQVILRTQELGKINTKLRQEIEERTRQEGERRTLEERLARAEKMEALGTLAGGVAHDLNNILTGLVSLPEILLLGLPEDHRLRKHLETIKNSGEKAAVIVQDLLTMARRGVAQHEVIDLNELVVSLFESPEFQWIRENHKEVVFSCSLSSEMSTIKGSRVHIMKSLTNLVTNGAEAIVGSGKLIISTTPFYVDRALKRYDQVREGEYVRLRVCDNGVGIPPENMEKIFEPFFTTKTMGRSGSGLGMAVVWGTVKDHGGYLDVKSNGEKGTIFDLYFPLIREKQALIAEKETGEILHGNGESVLVIDDVKEQRDIATIMLTKLGYQVSTAASGEAALEFLAKQKVDILVLDMIMHPGMDGLETYKKVVAIYPGQKAIIVSGYSESDKVLKAQNLGTGSYVKKPYNVKEIALALKLELDK